MKIKIFGEKLKLDGKGRRLSIFGSTTRADWRVVILIGIAAVIAGGVYAETRLAAVRATALQGELRRGGEDTLEVPEAADMVRLLDARGAAVVTPSAASSTPEASASTSPAV